MKALGVEERRQSDEDRDLAHALEESRKEALVRAEADRAVVRQVMEQSFEEAKAKAKEWGISQKDLDEAGPSK